MNYAVEMGLGAMMCIPNFRKTGSGVQKLLGGGNTHTHTHTKQGELNGLLLLFSK
jgi:hypothetical protein